jgi:predicted nucleotidyltransferase
VQWLEAGNGPVPTEFDILVQELVSDNNLRSAIENLIAIKRCGGESDNADRVPEFDAFIETELARLQDADFHLDAPRSGIESLNNIFRQLLQQVWS